ncbi:insulinase family protein, partial [Leeuwenhoekiella sp. NPDC079379]|uniref:insulinase family protein n=1 Tax=Leeuwenhoekiella sp. NPDC079379 TaxID=3364122 RepID=UPI0037C92038
MQDIKLLKLMNLFSLFRLLWSCFLLGSPFTYGQTQADTVETGTRSGTLANGMRYVIHSKEAWHGQTVSMNFYVHTGYHMEEEGQTDMAHFMEHLPYSVLREEAAAKPGVLLEAIQAQELPLQAGTNMEYTVYFYSFNSLESEIYTTGIQFFKRLLAGEFTPDPKIVKAEQGSFYQEYIHRNGANTFERKRILNKISNAITTPVYPERYYSHIKAFNWQQVESFYKDWYKPDRATLLMVGPITDLDEAEQNIVQYFEGLENHTSKEVENYKTEYLNRPNQYVKLEQYEEGEYKSRETVMHLFWRNTLPSKQTSKALLQKWMHELVYDLIGDHLRQIPTTYARHYSLGLDKGSDLPALGLELTCFTGREWESVQEVATALNQLKVQGITEVVFQKQKQNVLDALNRKDTNALGAVLRTYDQRMLAEESLEFDQLGLKKHWLNQLSYDTVNSELKAFLRTGPHDIGILAPKGAAVLNLSEAEFRSWLQENESGGTQSDELRETQLIPDSLIARLPRVTSQDLGSDALGGHVIQLGNGVRVVLYPQEGTPLKLHGFRELGAQNLKDKDHTNAYLVPEWVQTSGIGSFTQFELQRLFTDLGMIYGRALYVNDEECGIHLKAPLVRLETLLQLAHLYLSNPREDPAAFRYWQEEEFFFYKRPPYGR